jgi:hypothetical protein
VAQQGTSATNQESRQLQWSCAWQAPHVGRAHCLHACKSSFCPWLRPAKVPVLVHAGDAVLCGACRIPHHVKNLYKYLHHEKKFGVLTLLAGFLSLPIMFGKPQTAVCMRLCAAAFTDDASIAVHEGSSGGTFIIIYMHVQAWRPSAS